MGHPQKERRSKIKACPTRPDIVTYPPKNYKGIVAIQMRNHAEVLGQLMARLKEYLRTQPAMAHYREKLLVVEVNRIRIRE
jgi:hypothetical protein